MTNTTMRFNFAQTFYVEPDFHGHAHVKLTGFDLFFKYKPASVDNRSGITNPGVTIYLAETIYNVPLIDQNTFSNVARLEWNQILTSSNATVASPFRFPNPIVVTTGKMYALVVSFDGNETFWPWLAKAGTWIVGQGRTIYTGLSGNVIGHYYEYVSTDTHNDPTTASNQADYTSYWRALNDTTLKFAVHAARYFIQGVPIINANLAANVIVYSNNLIQTSDGNYQLNQLFPAQCMEHITFDLANSSIMTFIGAQKVFQNTVPYPGGFANGSSSVSVNVNNTSNNTLVVANTNLPNGTPFSWNTVYNGYTGQKYIVLFDTTTINVRLVRSIVSNTILQVTEPVTFTNTAAKFLISPIATIDSLDTNSPRGKRTEFMRLTSSNANSSVRFVNNCIEAITPNTGGLGYNNTDVLYIIGYENVAGKVTGGYPAIANIQTNTSGGITAVYLSNLGCGFVNTTNILATLANSSSSNTTSNTSAGSNATFTYSVGATLRSELTPNVFKNCTVVNLNLNDATPFFDIYSPAGTSFNLALLSLYYLLNDNTTFDGFSYYIYPGLQKFDNFTLLRRNRFISDKVPVFMSYSNEFKTLYSNGAPNDQINALTVTSNNFILEVETTSNNDFIIVTVDTTPTIEFGKYIFNNDYTNEHTNYGNCWAKHLTTHTNLARLSEDIRVYMDVYKPANTDIQVFARIQNSGDPEPFDDEDWTRLTLINGAGVVSSLSDENNYIELTWGFQQFPNTAFNLAGTVATVNASSNLVGSNTTFTANVSVGDMVRVYDPLFPANNFIVATVTVVTDNTHLTIDQPLLSTINPALIQSAMKIDKLGYKNQAYNNITNDNLVRYYNTSIVKYDGYDNLQLKVCLLSSQLSHVPKIHDIRAVATSA